MKAIYDIDDDSGIDQGSSTASYIENKGRIEKTDGTGVSTIVPGVTNDGKIEVTSGTLDFGGGISGTGADTISGASTLELDAEVSAGQTVHFTGSGGELALHKPGEFAGDISGFDTARAGSNDTIEVAEHWVFTGFSPGSGQGTLGFKNVSSSSVISLTLAGDYNPADFVHQTQANGSTLITYNGVSGLDTLLPFAGTHAGELDIGSGATGSGRLDLGSGEAPAIVDHQMAEHDLIGLPQRRHHVRRFAVTEGVETAAQGLAVNRDRSQADRRRRRRNRQCMLAKRGLQSSRIDALNDQPQPGVGGRTAKPQAERFVQPLQMNANELMHLPVGVGTSDHAENGVQQHRGQIEPLAFVATTVWDGAQNLQQRCRHGTTSDSGCRL